MVKTSITLCLILRHKPELINAKLDSEGFLDVNFLIDGYNKLYDKKINRDILEEIVKQDEKGRYSFNDDRTKIRCNQGHNKRLNVNITFAKKNPPKVLYHGTSSSSLDSILRDGIKSMSRQYVHLSEDIETATKVGSRHGEVSILAIDVEAMIKDGLELFVSTNNVWLFDGVIEPKYFYQEGTKSHVTLKYTDTGLYGVIMVIPMFENNPIYYVGSIDKDTGVFTCGFDPTDPSKLTEGRISDLMKLHGYIKQKYETNMKKEYSYYSTHVYVLNREGEPENEPTLWRIAGLNAEMNRLVARNDFNFSNERARSMLITIHLEDIMRAEFKRKNGGK